MPDHTLWLTHCALGKNEVEAEIPEKLYKSERISEFIQQCSRKELKWAILSAKYGLFFADEKRPTYNRTFKSDPQTRQCHVLEDGKVLDAETSSQLIHQLIVGIREKMDSKKVDRIVFWPGRPRDGIDPLMRVKCYLLCLHAAADNCNIDHRSWKEIVQHIQQMNSSGRGKIVLTKELPNTGTDSQIEQQHTIPSPSGEQRQLGATFVQNLRTMVEMLETEDLQFSKDGPKLPVDVRSSTIEMKREVAHYLLLVIAIDISVLVGMSDNTRKLLSWLYFDAKLGERIYDATTDDFQKSMDLYAARLGRQTNSIPDILGRVNNFVNSVAKRDLVTWSTQYNDPQEIAEQLATHLNLGKPTSARKRVWVYLRWMVRPYPDLRVFSHLSPAKLNVPLDVNTASTFAKLGAFNGDLIQTISQPDVRHVEVATAFARQIYPDDPAKVDYPFFLLGRWLTRGARIPPSAEPLAKRIFQIQY